MIYDSVLFDLDGTLWDATAVSAATWVEVLARHPGVTPAIPLTQTSVRLYMGLTNEELAGIFFPQLPYGEALGLMRESCALENLWLPERGGTLYPDVRETLTALHQSGVRLGIVSNCQDGYIEAFLTAHRMWELFDDYESSGRSGKNKAENIAAVIARNGLCHPVYVGDTVSDQHGAEGAGIPFICCRYGFGETFGRGRADRWDGAIDAMRELPAVLERL